MSAQGGTKKHLLRTIRELQARVLELEEAVAGVALLPVGTELPGGALETSIMNCRKALKRVTGGHYD